MDELWRYAVLAIIGFAGLMAASATPDRPTQVWRSVVIVLLLSIAFGIIEPKP